MKKCVKLVINKNQHTLVSIKQVYLIAVNLIKAVHLIFCVSSVHISTTRGNTVNAGNRGNLFYIDHINNFKKGHKFPKYLFRRSQKIANDYQFRYVRPSVLQESPRSHQTDFRVILCTELLSEKIVQKMQVRLESDKNMRYFIGRRKCFFNPQATGLNFTCHLIILTLRLPD